MGRRLGSWVGMTALLSSGAALAQPAPVEAEAPSAAPIEEPAPAPAPTSVKAHRLLVLDLEPGNLDPGQAEVLSGLLTDALSRHPRVQVLSAGDIETLVALESDRQSAGCDTTSCLAEVASALGAEFVVYGQAGVLGELTLLQLHLFDSGRAQSIARERVEATSLDALPRHIDRAAHRLVARLPREEAPLAGAPSSLPKEHELLAGGGSALLLAGAGMAGMGFYPVWQHQKVLGDLQGLAHPSSDRAEVEALESQADGYETAWKTWGGPLLAAGVTLAVAGAVTASVGLGWGLLSSEEEADLQALESP